MKTEQEKKLYRDIKGAWAHSVNKEEYKPYKNEYGTKHEGKLNALHFLVYNIVRGFPQSRGFEPLGQGYEDAQNSLNFCLKFDQTEKLLFPFDNLITLETFKELLK